MQSYRIKMTSYSPRIYTYKITFEEVPYYYYGVHKEKKFNEYYMGTPATHKWVWDFYTPKKQILQLFDFTDEGWLEAQKVEKKLIKQFYNDDKWCLNESCGGKISLKVLRECGKIGGKKSSKKQKELGVGIYKLTTKQLGENGKIGGKKSKELGVGIHGRTKEQMSENGKNAGKIGGKKVKELGLGIHGLTPEQTSENARKGGKIGGSKGGKKSSSQKWVCLETGFITNPGNLTKYQRAKGINQSKRKRIE